MGLLDALAGDGSPLAELMNGANAATAAAVEQQAEQLDLTRDQLAVLDRIATALEQLAASAAVVDRLAGHPAVAALLRGESLTKAAMQR